MNTTQRSPAYVMTAESMEEQGHLGTYEAIEQAAQARKEAEELLFDGVAAFYPKWERQAAEDPEWAKKNPIKIKVSEDAQRGLSISFLPDGPE